MAAKRISMRRIREILRLHFVAHLRQRAIARGLGCSRPVVAEYLARAAEAGLSSWEQVEPLDESELERLLSQQERELPSPRPVADWKYVHAELKRDGVTRELLWQEYREQHPNGYGLSQFKALYARWTKCLSVVMRQQHRAGEKMFVDYCDGLSLVDARTGELIPTQLFVSALGASSYTFAEATLSQELSSWLQSHVHAFEFYNGVAAITVPDNLRSGVTKPCRYEAGINPSYQDLAVHYGTCVIPARVRKPRDKAKVEAAVLVAQRWILAVLRNRTFHTLTEMNAAISELLEKLNRRVMRQFRQSRLELYETIDRPALKPLPPTRYIFADWAKAKVNIDYHVEFDHHYYSVPYTLAHEVLELRASAMTVEIYRKGRRIYSHDRSYHKTERYVTRPEHMPESHRAHAEWTPSRIVQWAGTIGTATAALVETMLARKAHPEQAYRSALGIIRLAKSLGEQRVELAANKALVLNSPSYHTIKSILKNNTEAVPLKTTSPQSEPEPLFAQAHIRGGTTYQ